MDGLQLRNLCASPWGSPLLRDINFALASGDVLGLIGPNGAGKSSLLHCIAGGLPASAGQLLLGGEPLADIPTRQRARCIAMQVQHPLLNFPFTVEEVILLGRTPHASGQRGVRQILREVMAATDTAGLARRPYTQLSGGEKQRVQLARAVAQVWREEDAPQRLLLLDEPNSALDLHHQQMVLELVGQLASRGCAVLLASHDCNLLSPRVDHLLLLDKGAQAAYGTPAEVLTREMFSQVFAVQVHIQAHPGNGAPLVIQR
ncbi:heme ABC transporter ATP-binding protein [Seongchinamella sediminis]|uniref:Heme ABC transporter ATP-binding protein n=1 Tax=Seongchinamella sediminis TaxID=2283635 RepID=A0A3L7DYX8_9GAMM|nr:heme ABC transporter ATP-binding protein [Seongchinamella sediminis]RLQ22808.1 heme ABC transporter ATP-binding protein [Seongchinamella sediminis]